MNVLKNFLAGVPWFNLEGVK